MFDLKDLGVRPDKFDERDFSYRPRLARLDPHHFMDGFHHLTVLDQAPGECVGYATAGLIRHLLQLQNRYLAPAPEISPHMLYELARIYDEWEGEAYQGSSCRGALKGWHHHGACERDHWPGRWAESASRFPLGVYYRVDRESLTDLRLAIVEAGAVLVTAKVHRGWQQRFMDSRIQLIDYVDDSEGFHAFLLIGYNEKGFLAQNSWGDLWGHRGFAVLSYQEWLANGMDAWVVSMSTHTEVQPPRYRIRTGLHYWKEGFSPGPAAVQEPGWSSEKAREHTLVVARNGRFARRRIDAAGGDREMDQYFDDFEETQKEKRKRLLIFFPSGFDLEEEAVRTIRQLAPWLEEQGGAEEPIHPLFLLWRTGIAEDVHRLLEGDLLTDEALSPLPTTPEARDGLFEVLARRFMRPFWAEAKMATHYASRRADGESPIMGALPALIGKLKELEQRSQLEIHLAAHSAGALPMLKFLDLASSKDLHLPMATCSMLAPLCSAESAADTFERAFEEGILTVGNVHCTVLDPDQELRDRFGDFYSASFPTLVSRSLEREPSTPVLALAQAWNPALSDSETWHPDVADSVRRWGLLRHRYDIQCELAAPADEPPSLPPEPDASQPPAYPMSRLHAALGEDQRLLKALANRCRRYGSNCEGEDKEVENRPNAGASGEHRARKAIEVQKETRRQGVRKRLAFLSKWLALLISGLALLIKHRGERS